MYENYHNLREYFPVAEYTISQILEIETQKFVDESKIGFKVEPSVVDSTESGLSELQNIYIFINNATLCYFYNKLVFHSVWN